MAVSISSQGCNTNLQFPLKFCAIVDSHLFLGHVIILMNILLSLLTVRDVGLVIFDI